jgi:molybdate transport system substrate-binding protein
MSLLDRGRSGRALGSVLLCLVSLVLSVAAAPCLAQPVRILAAFTLEPALDEIVKDFNGGPVSVVYGASPTLAKQIENGIPADLFFSADQEWMDEVARQGLLKPGTTTELIGNRLVLIARTGTRHRVTISPGFPLARLVGGGPLAMCDPDSHPAGRDGKSSLVKLGVWKSVEKKVASVENPLVAVKMVARGDVPIAIVFATDAATDSGVEIVGIFPDDTHPKIRYPVAILAQSRNPAGSRFLDFLKSPTARAVFGKFGYVTLDGD